MNCLGCDCLDTCTRVCHSQQGFVPMVLDSLRLLRRRISFSRLAVDEQTKTSKKINIVVWSVHNLHLIIELSSFYI